MNFGLGGARGDVTLFTRPICSSFLSGYDHRSTETSSSGGGLVTKHLTSNNVSDTITNGSDVVQLISDHCTVRDASIVPSVQHVGLGIDYDHLRCTLPGYLNYVMSKLSEYLLRIWRHGVPLDSDPVR